MQNLTPYLMFNGNCEKAINYYAKCFDGEVGYLGRYGDSPMKVNPADRDKIMHVEFKFWGGLFMASDHIDEANYTSPANGSNIHMSLGFKDKDIMTNTFDKLAMNGKISLPLQEQFWGDTFGMLTDQFGIHWMFTWADPKKKKDN